MVSELIFQTSKVLTLLLEVEDLRLNIEAMAAFKGGNLEVSSVRRLTVSSEADVFYRVINLSRLVLIVLNSWHVCCNS